MPDVPEVAPAALAGDLDVRVRAGVVDRLAGLDVAAGLAVERVLSTLAELPLGSYMPSIRASPYLRAGSSPRELWVPSGCRVPVAVVADPVARDLEDAGGWVEEGDFTVDLEGEPEVGPGFDNVELVSRCVVAGRAGRNVDGVRPSMDGDVPVARGVTGERGATDPGG